MFRVIRFDSLIKILILITMALSVMVYHVIQHYYPNIDLFKLITISSFITLIILFLILSPKISRLLWKIIYYFNKSLYPDLNGTWEGEIELKDNAKMSCKAIIRQTLLYTHIDLHTETTKSVTLETTPEIEKGQLKLYYIYRSDPKNPNWGSYNGSTIFDIRNIDENGISTIELSGIYYTSRETSGRIKIKRIGIKIDTDVSYY